MIRCSTKLTVSIEVPRGILYRSDIWILHESVLLDGTLCLLSDPVPCLFTIDVASYYTGGLVYSLVLILHIRLISLMSVITVEYTHESNHLSAYPLSNS